MEAPAAPPIALPTSVTSSPPAWTIWGDLPVTPDHINPGNPWPRLPALRAFVWLAGFALEPRLPIHEGFLRREGFVSPRGARRRRGGVDAVVETVSRVGNEVNESW